MGVVTVIQGSIIRKIEYMTGESILVCLRRNQITVPAPCGGNGTCGKCRVTVEVLDQGKQSVLACQTKVQDQMVIYLEDAQTQMHAVTEFSKRFSGADFTANDQKEYGIVIDLGTTTVVCQLIQIPTKKVIKSVSELNAEYSYGADVIARISSAMEGNQEAMTKLIREQLERMVRTVLDYSKLSQEQLERIVIAGNTTMLHLLRGYSVEMLGRYPFQPVSLKLERLTVKEIEVVLLPGISTFVGADITSGLFGLDFYTSEKLNFLLDLGTNGEIAVGNRTGILASATAAGPAFEGGNLSCGIGSVPGAISHATIRRNYTKYETIDNKSPIGICGTGAIEILAGLLEKDIIDETGLLREKDREKGFVIANHIVFTQEDIRQMQLAKSAIRSGIEILLKTYGAAYNDISSFYLAGGMGFTLDVKKAVQIGLLPEEIADRVVVVGNSSLGGAVRFLCEKNSNEHISRLAEQAKAIELARQTEFNEQYINYLNFDKQFL